MTKSLVLSLLVTFRSLARKRSTFLSPFRNLVSSAQCVPHIIHRVHNRVRIKTGRVSLLLWSLLFLCALKNTASICFLIHFSRKNNCQYVLVSICSTGTCCRRHAPQQCCVSILIVFMVASKLPVSSSVGLTSIYSGFKTASIYEQSWRDQYLSWSPPAFSASNVAVSGSPIGEY